MKNKLNFSRIAMVLISLVMLGVIVAVPLATAYGWPALASQQAVDNPYPNPDIYSGIVELQWAAEGEYDKTLIEPQVKPDLDSIDLGFLANCSNGTLSGYVNLSATLVFPELHTITISDDSPAQTLAVGPSISGSCGASLVILSEKFEQKINQISDENEPGETVTRQFQLIGALNAATNSYEGEYRETLWSYGLQPVTMVGRFTLVLSSSLQATQEYTLTVNSAHGTVTKNPDWPTYHSGDVVALTVAPEAGWTFTGWTPSLTNNRVTITGDTTVTANYLQAPVLTWANPSDIPFGTALSDAQLNATASTPGTFTYNPAAGTVLGIGTHTLHVDFTPTDTATYAPASRDVSITVTKSATVITWANPADIVYGTPLGATQLNATANTPGAFTYNPVSGTVLAVGTHTLHVDFTPTDTVNYTPASRDVSITVTKIAPVITWADPTAIAQGTPLSTMQLNATADVPGAFTYTPTAGAFLSAGMHTLHVDFVPTDAVHYANTSRDVSLIVLGNTIFADVPEGHWARSFIERLYLNHVTSGCGGTPLNYCPDTNVNRAMMAVFVLRATHGPDFTPPPATGEVFTDVPVNSFAAWIEELAAEGITSGCGDGMYCPNAPVTRAQMAVFLVKAMYGADYIPPAATGAVFTDIPANGFAAAFIEQLASDGVTSGCGGGNFCPNAYITRAQMAVFLVKAFSLP